MTPFAATLAALLALPMSHEDRADPLKPAQYAAIALEVSKLKPPPGVGAKEWRALVLAVGLAESGFSLRVMDGKCRAFECDRGKARSAWQLHSNLFTAPVWDELQGLHNVAVQVATADAMMKRAYHQCKSTPSDVWIRPTVNAFAGRGCDTNTIIPWKGFQLRFAYWLKARRAMG